MSKKTTNIRQLKYKTHKTRQGAIPAGVKMLISEEVIIDQDFKAKQRIRNYIPGLVFKEPLDTAQTDLKWKQ